MCIEAQLRTPPDRDNDKEMPGGRILSVGGHRPAYADA